MVCYTSTEKLIISDPRNTQFLSLSYWLSLDLLYFISSITISVAPTGFFIINLLAIILASFYV
jgi:hypothetical protein